MNVTTTAPVAKYKSGYDLPVFGLANGEFIEFHATALACMGLSALSALTICVVSFATHGFRTFFKWTKGERLVIYLALCDGLFNISHSLDHSHYLLTKDHVRPVWVCKMYGFILTEFITAQTLIVQVVAASAFLLMVFKKQISYGKRDWKLLVYTFGLPCIGGIVAAVTDQYGPSGAFCYFDAINGYVGGLIFTTGLMTFVMVSNIIFYIFTWRQIHKDIQHINQTLDGSASSVRSSANAAKTMLLFVVAFFVQWWALSVYGLWTALDPDNPPPLLFFKLVTTFSNLGGVINGIVYIIIRYRMSRAAQKRSQEHVTKRISNVSSSVDSTSFTHVSSAGC